MKRGFANRRRGTAADGERPVAGGPGRAATALLLAVVAVLGLTSCATIPDHGPVISGNVVNDDPLEGVVQLAPEGPKAGQSPIEVVRGFLAASAGFRDDHAIARSFLSPERRLAWRPDASVTVFRSLTSLTTRQMSNGEELPEPDPSATPTPTVNPSAGGGTAQAAPGAAKAEGSGTVLEVAEVVVRTPVIAEVDSSGRYSLVAPGAKIEPRHFGLVLLDGHWRINSLDDGILITRNDFNVTFKPSQIYFPESHGEYLVPDTHWFPRSPGSPELPTTLVRELPTTLVRALLEGPPTWLADAVASSIPNGTEMSVSAVTVENNTAT